jgi:hypothetical protein
MQIGVKRRDRRRLLSRPILAIAILATVGLILALSWGGQARVVDVVSLTVAPSSTNRNTIAVTVSNASNGSVVFLSSRGVPTFEIQSEIDGVWSISAVPGGGSAPYVLPPRSSLSCLIAVPPKATRVKIGLEVTALAKRTEWALQIQDRIPLKPVRAVVEELFALDYRLAADVWSDLLWLNTEVKEVNGSNSNGRLKDAVTR